MAEFDVDLFVIGGGSGGVRAARIAANYGAKVMVAEEYRMGGTCVIRGCVPKKLFVIGSHVHQEIEDAAGFGWNIGQISFDWATLVANKDKEIARLEAAYTTNVEKSGARIVKTRAVLEDAHTISLATGEKVTAKYILIATGAHPLDKKMENHDTVNVLAEFETGHQMLVIGATNNEPILDSAFMRSGRFDRKVYVGLPDAPARKIIFGQYLKKIKLASEPDLDKLAKQTTNFSGGRSAAWFP